MKIRCEDFDLASTLDSGQVFGFKPIGNGKYEGILRGHAVCLWQEKDFLNVRALAPAPEELIFFESEKTRRPLRSAARRLRQFSDPKKINSSGAIFSSTVQNYFDLRRDLTPIYSIIQSDSSLEPAYKVLKGLRLIRQDPWEALACFILSSNNNVKRIMGIHENLVNYFCAEERGFPSSAQIARSHENILRQLGLGYRAPFLLKTATFLSHNPGYLENLRDMEFEEAKNRVLCFPGIGPKVADCVLLYGFHRLEAFPVDVWIARVVRHLYFKRRKIPEDKIRAFGMKRWGANAGYVQQYLFHAARTGILAL